MPEVLIRGCYFARTSTRGALLSSWRKTVVEDNTFKNTGSPAIFCNTGDSYGQQGAVKDLTIRHNVFSGCRGGVFLKPEQPEASVKNPIMENVVITGNTFSNWDGSRPLLWARSSRDIRFLDNTVETTGPASVWLGASSQITIKCNHISSGKGRIELAGGTTADTVFADAWWVITP
jgi:polygalacturonase